MTVRTFCLVFCFMLSCALPASASHVMPWPPPERRTFSSPNGRFVLTVEPTQPGKACRATLEEPADSRLLWSLELPHPVTPVAAAVSEDGAWVATSGDWGSWRPGPRELVLYHHGRLVRQLDLWALLPPAEVWQFVKPSTSGRRWIGSLALDSTGQRVLFERWWQGSLREVDLQSGLARDPEPGAAVTLLRLLGESAGEALVARASEADARAVAPLLVPLVRDPALPREVRLQAAVGLARAGDLRGRSLVESAPEPWILAHLPRFQGSAVLPRLLAALDDPALQPHSEEGLALLGKDALSSLATMLADVTRSQPRRISAVRVLARLDSSESRSLVDAATGDGDPGVRSAAVEARASWATAADTQVMLRHLERGESAAAAYFARFPCPAAIPSLLQATRGSHSQAAWGALEFQTGADLGPDIEVWERWVAAGASDEELARLGDPGGLIRLARAGDRDSLSEALARTPRLQAVWQAPRALDWFRLDGEAVVASGFSDGGWRAWALREQKLVAQADEGFLRELDPQRRLALLSDRGLKSVRLASLDGPDGPWLPCESWRGVDFATGRVFALVADGGFVPSRLVAYEGWTGRVLFEIPECLPRWGHEIGEVGRGPVLRDEGRLLVLDGSRIRLVDTRTGRCLPFPEMAGGLVDASADGRVLALQTPQGLVVRDSRGRVRTGPLPMPAQAALSPDGEYLLTLKTMRDGGTLLVQRISSPTVPRVVDQNVSSLSISPDSRRAAGLCRDGRVRLWDLSTGRLEGTLTPLGDWFPSLTGFSPDSQVLVTHSGSAVALWDLAQLGEKPQIPPDPVEFVERWTGLSLRTGEVRPLQREIPQAPSEE